MLNGKHVCALEWVRELRKNAKAILGHRHLRGLWRHTRAESRKTGKNPTGPNPWPKIFRTPRNQRARLPAPSGLDDRQGPALPAQGHARADEYKRPKLFFREDRPRAGEHLPNYKRGRFCQALGEEAACTCSLLGMGQGCDIRRGKGGRH
jgi:hypothetical protein